MKYRDLAGQKFGLMTAVRVLDVITTHGGKKKWFCDCDCGTKDKLVQGTNLTSGQIQSCGCLLHKKGEESSAYRHGSWRKREYRIWTNMKARCSNEKETSYPDYGGRGISVCPEWQESFINFYKDMGDCPEGLTLERIDVDGNYCPENCIWVTRRVQANNRRNTTLMFHEGEWLPPTEWERRLGIKLYNLGVWSRKNIGKTVQNYLDLKKRRRS